MFWFKKRETRKRWRLEIFYRTDSRPLLDNFQSKTSEMCKEFDGLAKWYLHSKKRYHNFVYDEGCLLLDREYITSIKIFRVTI